MLTLDMLFCAFSVHSVHSLRVNSYKLNDKSQDQNFLSGIPVKGTAVFLKSEFKSDLIKINTRIVILLSNGKKYMGKITHFAYISKGKIIEGEVEIVKA